MAFIVKEAKRELIWAKIALMAPSGGGKTYSALRVATGMLEKLKELGQEQNGKILLGNTEQKRGYYYANEFKYDIVDIDSPHNPEKYVEFIEFAVENRYPIVIIDSTSHEWEGKGGCLELHQMAGGTYQSWGKVTPRHDKFIISIADSPIHVIATMRGKDQYEMEKEGGKTTVKKLGVGARQREGFEYEFTVTFNIDQKTNMASVQKDNTHLFEDEGDVMLSEKHGTKIVEWANSGEGYTPPVRNAKNPTENLSELQDKAIALCQDLGGSKNDVLMGVLKEFTESANPKKIKDLEKLTELVGKLTEMKENK
jgi:hypothetical protein